MSSGLWYWELKIIHCSGHNDRIGIVEEADIATLGKGAKKIHFPGKPLTSFGIHLMNNPGQVLICDSRFKPIKPLTSQATTNHVIGFLLDFRVHSVKIYLNGNPVAEYSIPQG